MILFGGQGLLRTRDAMCIPLLCVLLPLEVVTVVSLGRGLGISIFACSQVILLLVWEH